MLIKDAMRIPVFTRPETTITEAAKQMDKHNVGALPVVKDQKLIGIVTDRDICCRALGRQLDPASTYVEQIMTKNVLTCYEDQDLYAAAVVMEHNKIRRVPVVDRRHHLVGMITLADLSHHVGSELTAEVESNVTTRWR